MVDELVVGELRCEYTRNPLGLENRRPRLSWVLKGDRRGARQTAFEILVADNSATLHENHGNMWKSGKVISDSSFHVEYSGRALKSRVRYYWKVRVWDEFNHATEFSEASWWEMGLLEQLDWRAKWIGGGRLFRKEFTVDKRVTRARAYVSGLSYYEFRINGRKVGDRVLDPAPSMWEKRVYYAVYDVTDYLRVGNNTAGVILGRGKKSVAGTILQIEIECVDASRILVCTDESWFTSQEPPFVSDDLYDGESYDARLEKEPRWDCPEFTEEWKHCKKMEDAPIGRIVSSAFFPPIRVTQTLKPVATFTSSPGTFVIDFGQNISGWVRIRASGKRGTRIIMKFAELLNPDRTINSRTNRAAKSTDVFILKGEGLEEYEPHFTYHGFRYVEITGYPGVISTENVDGRVVHTDVESTGGFICSTEIINKIHTMTKWSQKSNLMGIPTDSPQRNERLGWLQDVLLSAEEAVYNFWMVGFFEKFLWDIADSQLDDGSIPDVVPSHGERYPADSTCGATYAAIAYALYVFYGDRRALEEHYERIKRWVEYESSRTVGYILDLGKYGDWCSPGHVKPDETPSTLISTFWHLENCMILAEISRLLGREDDSKKFKSRCELIRRAFNKRFLNRRKDRNYAHTQTEQTLWSYGNTQTCNVLPLYLGIVPRENLDEVLRGLVDDVKITKDGHLATGIIGTRFIFETLIRYGQPELALRIATQVTYPSFGYMANQGATTLWERWEYLTGNGMNSHNHVMFGSIDAWFYKSLAGMSPDPLHPGFQHFSIEPCVVRDLESAVCSIDAMLGQIRVEWRTTGSSFKLNVTVPPNATATIYIPTLGMKNVRLKEGRQDFWENGRVSTLPPGVAKAREDFEKGIKVELTSGAYSFLLEEGPERHTSSK